MRSRKALISLSIISIFSIGQAFAQQSQPTPAKVNFGYSQNPKTKPKKETTQAQTNNQPPTTEQSTNNDNRTVAQKTFEIAKRANSTNFAPTEIYKVGVGDVLFISLQNAPSRESNYFTVLNNGTIDYPLAGEMVSVAGLTPDEIEDLLKGKIRLYENPQISVKLREYASHSITVLGLVEKPGVKYIQREAVPLYVVRAEAVALSKANGVTIKRANAQTEKLDLKDSKSEEVLVFPGDIVEFTSGGKSSMDANAPQFYYIGGGITSGGQKDFYQGITLTQAILVSGGLKKSDTKKVVIRRKNEEGLLIPTEYNLKDIKNGKAPDPILQAGDTIEIGN